MLYGILVIILILILIVIRQSFFIWHSEKRIILLWLKKIWDYIRDWRTFVSFAIAWLITNGWGWVFMFLGRFLHIKWMKYAGDAYIAFLWLPFVNEKVVTIALAAFIKKLLFRRKK